MLNNGQLHAGRLSRASQVDTWTFTAAAGDYVIVGVGNASGTTAITPWVRFVGPTGQLLAEDARGGSAQISRTAPVSGTYTVIAGSYGSSAAGAGEYVLSVSGASASRLLAPSRQPAGLRTSAGANHP